MKNCHNSVPPQATNLQHSVVHVAATASSDTPERKQAAHRVYDNSKPFEPPGNVALGTDEYWVQVCLTNTPIDREAGLWERATGTDTVCKSISVTMNISF